jgi:hypothetical protein
MKLRRAWREVRTVDFHIFHSFTLPEPGVGGGAPRSRKRQDHICAAEMIVEQTEKYIAIGVAPEGTDGMEVAKDFAREGVDMHGRTAQTDGASQNRVPGTGDSCRVTEIRSTIRNLYMQVLRLVSWSQTRAKKLAQDAPLIVYRELRRRET